jgi:prepilin-type N-terminal cleavage/methylation domain-containing protein
LKKKKFMLNQQLTVLNRKPAQDGFSLIEILVVLVVGLIMVTLSLFYLVGHKNLYKVEDQALQIVDVLQEAKQLALNQRQTMRVEINSSKNALLIIDENGPGDSDDREIRRLPLLSANEAKIGSRPGNIAAEPNEPSPVPQPSFQPSSHPLTQANSVAVLRFTSTGRVLNAGTNSVGAGATMTGMTIYVWKPRRDNASNAEMTRGITVLGASGTIRMWNFDHNAATPKWVAR